MLVRTSAGQVWVLWDGDEEPTYYTQGDARYWVDTNRWRISPPRERSVFSVIGGKEPESSQKPAALTSPPGDGSIASRREGGTPLTEEDDMATEASSKTDESDKASTLSAKNIARRLGTDAKTLRKFFRSAASTVEPVGQGGRYEFAPEDLPQIVKEFKSWETNKTAAPTKKAPTPVALKGPKPKAAPVVEEIDEDEGEPTDEDLAELDEELSLEDLDD